MYLCMLYEMIVCQKKAVVEYGKHCVHLGEVRNRWFVDLYKPGHLVHMYQKSQNRCIHTSTQHTHKPAHNHTHCVYTC